MKFSLDDIKKTVCRWLDEKYGIWASPEDLHVSINQDSGIVVIIYLKGDVTYLAQYAFGNPNARVKVYELPY